jgi:hypothetical protein
VGEANWKEKITGPRAPDHAYTKRGKNSLNLLPTRSIFEQLGEYKKAKSRPRHHSNTEKPSAKTSAELLKENRKTSYQRKFHERKLSLDCVIFLSY